MGDRSHSAVLCGLVYRFRAVYGLSFRLIGKKTKLKEREVRDIYLSVKNVETEQRAG